MVSACTSRTSKMPLLFVMTCPCNIPLPTVYVATSSVWIMHYHVPQGASYTAIRHNEVKDLTASMLMRGLPRRSSRTPPTTTNRGNNGTYVRPPTQILVLGWILQLVVSGVADLKGHSSMSGFSTQTPDQITPPL